MGNTDSKTEQCGSTDRTVNQSEPVTFSNVARNEARDTAQITTNPREILGHPSNIAVVRDTTLPDTATVRDSPNMASQKDDIETKLKNLNIQGRKDINILLLGETGIGKSTFINSIFNYLQFEDFEKAEKENLNVLIPSSFTIFDKDDKVHYIEVGSREDKNESLEVGKSATQGVKTYTFHIKNGQILVRLIDTPGMGDTRGIEQDDINCENILNYISRIHELHAICYLCRPQQSRATAYFKYCVAQIMSRLEKSACQNIIFVFTNSRGNNYSPGDTFQLLKQMAEEISANPANAKIPLDENRFCFDNEAFRFLAAIKNGVEFRKDIRRNSIESWKRSTQECWKMIEYILGLRPHFVKHTAAINEARRIIYQLAQPMADIAQLVNDNIYVLQNHEGNLNVDRQSLGELKKRLYIPVIDLEVTQLTQPVTVCTDLKCSEVYNVGERKEWHYKTRCHDPCYLTNVPKDIMGSPELINCASMGPDQICKKCTHSYKVHMHVYYMTKKKQSQKQDNIVLKSINTKELVIENAQKIIEGIKERKNKLEKELNVIVRCNAKFAHFLQNNAIAPFSDSYADYINHLIIKEKGLGANADITKMAGLERLLREHNEMKKIFAEAADMQKILGKTDEITPQAIANTMQDLFKMELNGKKIKELYDSQKKSINKEHDYSEYVHKGTFSQSAPDSSKKDQNKGKSSASNPTTKFQRGRQNNQRENQNNPRVNQNNQRGNQNNQRGNQNNQRGNQYQRGRSAGPHQSDPGHRTPPPPYDSAANAHRPGYPPTSPQFPQGYPNYPHQPYPPQGAHAPYPPTSPQPTDTKKPDDKAPTIQVHVTLPPTGSAAAGDNYPPRDTHPRDPRDYPYPDHRDYPGGYPPRDYPRDYPPRDYPPRDYPYPPRDPRDAAYPPRDPNYPPRDPYYTPPNYPPRDPYYHPRDPHYPPRDPYYPPRDPHYPARPDYPPRDPYYDQRYPSSSQHPPNPPPPQGPYNNNQQSGNYQQNQNRRGQDNRGGNRGRGNFNKGGINRRYRKKHDNANANANSGDDSDTSVASSKK